MTDKISEKLWAVPESWEWVKLKDLGTVVSGGTPSTKNSAYWGGKVNWITPADLTGYTEKYISSGAKSITKEGLKNSSARLMPKGSVLFSSRAPVGYVAIASSALATNQGFKSVVPGCGLDSEFVYYYLKASKALAESRASGTTFKELSGKAFSNLPVAVAPANEQHRIVAKIEQLFSELDKGVESLKAARAQLKTYRQSLLKAAFEGHLTEQWRYKAKKADNLTPVETTLAGVSEIPRPNRWKTRSKDVIYAHPCLAVGNPKTPLPDEWHWVPLVDVARMESGHTPSRRHPEWWDGDIPWIGIADARANNGKIITETTQYTNEEGLNNSAARLLPKGTVCVSRTASVGYVVEMGCSMATSQDFVNWIPSEAVTSAWLRLIFGAHKEYLLRFGKGTTHRTIYFPEWLSVHIGLPPLEEQKRIVEVVEAKLSQMDALEHTMEQSLGQSKALRQSILKRAFEGKFVPQDPNDEPASVLIERIRQEQADTPKPKRHKRKAGATS